MKKKIIFIVLLSLILFTSVAQAQKGMRTSGLKTEDAAILARPGYFHGIEIITDGTNDASVIVYDNVSAASGTIIFQGTIKGTNNFGGVIFIDPVEMFNGIYIDMTGVGMSYIVYYRVK